MALLGLITNTLFAYASESQFMKRSYLLLNGQNLAMFPPLKKHDWLLVMEIKKAH